MTVYELIQELAQYDATDEVRFKVWASPEQIEVYVEEWKDEDDEVCFTALAVDEVGIGWIKGKHVNVTLQVEDL